VRAVRAQTCVHHHISSIDGQTAGPIGLKICKNTHSLGLCNDHRVVGELECARVCAVHAQTCVQHHISTICGQTAGPDGLNISTNTHWNYAKKIGGSVNSSKRACVLRARKRAYITTYPP
jgi:hypothetical protein